MSAAESSVAASRALDDLYRKHVNEVYRYAYAVLGNHADAEDVTQTTFVNALRALERGERPRKPSNWLITITHNIVRQRFRQQQARPTEVVLDRDVPQEVAGDEGPTMEELVRALQRIPQSQREALVMRELEGRPYNEIAQILGLSAGALETLLFRARRSLADELENLVTCDRAELGLSKQLDGRLSRKERKRLDDHIAECPSCARLLATQGKQRRAFKGLALLPLPLSLTLFKGTPSASAAAGLPTIGLAGTSTVVGGTAATTGGGGLSLGGLAIGGIAVKAAAVVAAVSVVSGVGYVGAKQVQSHLDHPAKKTPIGALAHGGAKPKPRPASAGGAGRSASETSNGKALATGAARATSPTGASRGETAPGQTDTAPGLANDHGQSATHDTTTPDSAKANPDTPAAGPKTETGKPAPTPARTHTNKGKSAVAHANIEARQAGATTVGAANAKSTPTKVDPTTPKSTNPGAIRKQEDQAAADPAAASTPVADPATSTTTPVTPPADPHGNGNPNGNPDGNGHANGNGGGNGKAP